MTEEPSGDPRPEEPVTSSAPAVPRPLAVTGLVGAAWCVGIGLTVLTTITLVGWIAAPRTALGPGLPGVFRTAVNLWLVAHHAGFSVKAGRVGLLPLGLMVLPGVLLHRSGGWIVRVTDTTGPRRAGVGQVAVALAAPYAMLAGLLALAARSDVVNPSAWQALLVCFVIALVAGGLGAARAMVALRGRRVRSGLGALLRLLPDRPRSLVMGVVGSLCVLTASGALLVGASLALHVADAKAMYEMLAPGAVGGLLLFLVELVFLPNAVIWGMCYTVGPGFAVGQGTSVSPTGVFLNIIPSFPPLAALPEAGPAPALSLLALGAPFVAGAVGGVLTIRALPSPVYEAAPLWGFLSGTLTGLVTAVLAALSGGPLGGGRLATMGPSAWQVGVMATLEVGVAAAIAAWVANWFMLRRPKSPRVSRRAARRAERRAARRLAETHAGNQEVPVQPGSPAEPAQAGTAGNAGKAGTEGRVGKAGKAGRPRKATAALREPVPGPAADRGGRAGRPGGADGTGGRTGSAPPSLGEPVQFVEPEPVLAVRRPPRRSPGSAPVRPPDERPLGRDDERRSEEPPTTAGGSKASSVLPNVPRPAEPYDREDDGDWESGEDPESGGDDPESGREDRGVAAEATEPSDPRIERRSGALYVLKNDPPPD